MLYEISLEIKGLKLKSSKFVWLGKSTFEIFYYGKESVLAHFRTSEKPLKGNVRMFNDSYIDYLQ